MEELYTVCGITATTLRPMNDQTGGLQDNPQIKNGSSEQIAEPPSLKSDHEALTDDPHLHGLWLTHHQNVAILELAICTAVDGAKPEDDTWVSALFGALECFRREETELEGASSALSCKNS